MRLLWELPPQLSAPPAMSFVDVLVEYAGPQVAICAIDGAPHIGVASDDDGAVVRWLLAPISHVEVQALGLGSATVRDLLARPSVVVLDLDADDQPLRMWSCSASQIPEAALPARGALLPRLVREDLLAQHPAVTANAFTVEQRNRKTTGIEVRSLSDFLNVVQRLWKALAQAVRVGPPKALGRWVEEVADAATLSIAATSSGSLVMHLETANAELYSRVANTFEGLVAVRDDPTMLASMLTTLGPRVQQLYSALLNTLFKHDLVVLERRDGGAAFVAGFLAPRILAALPKGSESEPAYLRTVGSFVAFDSRLATFKLQETGSDEVYEGAVFPSVIDVNPTVLVGVGAKYLVLFQVITSTTIAGDVVNTYALAELTHTGS